MMASQGSGTTDCCLIIMTKLQEFKKELLYKRKRIFLKFSKEDKQISAKKMLNALHLLATD